MLSGRSRVEGDWLEVVPYFRLRTLRCAGVRVIESGEPGKPCGEPCSLSPITTIGMVSSPTWRIPQQVDFKYLISNVFLCVFLLLFFLKKKIFILQKKKDQRYNSGRYRYIHVRAVLLLYLHLQLGSDE